MLVTRNIELHWPSRVSWYARCCLLTQLRRCSMKKAVVHFYCFAILSLFLLSAMESSRGCLGCVPNPHLIKGQAMNIDNRSEDFWSSSAFEIDPSALQSQKSISSIVIPSDPQSSAGIQIDSPEYVNHGLRLWKQMRKQWAGNGRPGNKKRVGEPVITWNGTYESLMGTDKPFPRPIPLGEMVDFLVDIWELEGLYD